NNHTATHILNFALLKVLGEGVDQKGSLVAPDKFRFDFSQKSAPSVEQLDKVERICNSVISTNAPVYSKEVSLAVAKKIHGLRAVFGEVYPDPVRVVAVGYKIEDILADPSNAKWAETSIEFCGGTHVNRTGDIKGLAILEEASIAKGIRRIVAATAEVAEKAKETADSFESKLEKAKSLSGKELEAALKTLGKELDEITIPAVRKSQFRKTHADLKRIFDDADKARKAREQKEAVELIKGFFEENPQTSYLVKDLKAVSAALAHVKGLNTKSALLLTVDEENGKVSYASVVCKDHVEKGLKGSEWANVVSKAVNGRSGGKDDSAQGAGSDVTKLLEALKLSEGHAKKFL
ncbi:Alanine--tRNA ligase, partial [Cladochytrium tenue]